MGRKVAFLMALQTAVCLGRGFTPGEHKLDLRGKRQDIYFYPGNSGGQSVKGTLLFAPGDGGWRGFAVTIAKAMAGWGYDVYGIDTKRYLESFTGDTPLKESDVISDFRTIARRIGNDGKVCMVGWSEGAGLGLLATGSTGNKKTFEGFVAVGLGEASVLGWKTLDDITYITKKMPNEPQFESLPWLPKVSPLPLVMIYSDQDEYTRPQEARVLFSAAREPKRLSMIAADNHRFGGNLKGFLQALQQGLEWACKKSR